MRIWIVSREFAGIAEAGGVKNVTSSLAKCLSTVKIRNSLNEVTVFIPFYGSANLEKIRHLKKIDVGSEFYDEFFELNGLSYFGGDFSFESNSCSSDSEENEAKIKFVFARHKIFEEKKGVYTYTKEEEKENPLHLSGNGHLDSEEEDVLFQKAVSFYGMAIDFSKCPDLVLCQDAATALVPVFSKKDSRIKDFYKNSRFFVAIHNAGLSYHHFISDFSKAQKLTGFENDFIEKNSIGENFEPLLAASDYAKFTTVSDEYSRELKDKGNDFLTGGLSSKFYERNIEIKGICNGIDFDSYNPCLSEKSLLPFALENEDFSGWKSKTKKYFAEKIWNENPLLQNTDLVENHVFLCFHGRLVSQKGVDLFFEAIPDILKEYENVEILVMGQGEKCLEEKAFALREKFPQKFYYYNGYSKSLSRLIIAASDFIVLPSRFEPCGLEDLIANIFCTIPVAHKTGGLNKIIDGKTGFLYEKNDRENLFQALKNAINLRNENFSEIEKIRKFAFENAKTNYNWEKIVEKEYIPLFLEN